MGLEEHGRRSRIAALIILSLLVGSVMPALAALARIEDVSVAEDVPPEILWQGDVALMNGTTMNVTAYTSGAVYEVASATAFGALAAAAAAGAFNYTVSDEWGFLYLDSIADVPNEGWTGWMYWVNYPEAPMPMVGATDYAVEDGDVVTWYWSSGMEMSPADSPRLVLITVSVDEPAVVASSDYPTLQYDAQRTGNVPGGAPKTATLLWRSNEKTAGCIQAGPLVSNGRVYSVTWASWMSGNASDALYCLDKDSGEVIWHIPEVRGASTPAIAGNLLFVGTQDGRLACVNTTSRTVEWSEKIDTTPSFHGVASSPLVYRDRVYVLSFTDGTLHAFSGDGTAQWNFTTGGEIFCYSSPAAFEDRIFFAGNASGQHALYCVNLSTHEAVWNFSTATEIRGSPTIWPEEGLVFFTTKYVYGRSYGLYAVNITTGEEAWHVSHKSSWASPALSDGRLYIGGSMVDPTFYCYRATNGSLVWKKSELEGALDSSPVVAGGTVYFGVNSLDGSLYALDAADGSTRWNYTVHRPPGFGGGLNVASHPAVADRTLYIGMDNMGVLAFRDPSSGEFDTGVPAHPYPSIAGRHYGTLTPFRDLAVTTVSLRACAGTGGHTRSFKLWNDTWVGVEVQGDGYSGDWRTLSFEGTVTLHKNETYYYRIDTGSYPLLHPEARLQLSDGIITCTNFTDVNGAVHSAGIPALRLYGR